MTNNEIKLKTEKWRYTDDDGNYVDFREEVERLLVSTTYLGTSPAALHAEWILAAGICSHARLIMRTTSCLVIGSQLPSSSVWPIFHAFQMARKRDLNDRMTSTSRGCTTDVQPPGLPPPPRFPPQHRPLLGEHAQGIDPWPNGMGDRWRTGEELHRPRSLSFPL